VADWAHQAAQMADIFSHAYITIAASAAENGQQGLLNRRKTYRIDKSQGDTNYSVCVRGGIQHELLESSRIFPADSTSLRLRQRAWCFQEEILSTRIAHFTRDEVVFVCREATACECKHGWFSRFQLPPFIGSSHLEPYEIWSDVVAHYTQRQISFPKDRLPAISSLTWLLGEDTDRYLAGIWESHLPAALLWFTERGNRPEPEYASRSSPPSWSWASIEGGVRHLVQSRTSNDTKEVAEVLDAYVKPSTTDARGMVSGGHITLRGPLFPTEGTWKRYGEETKVMDFGLQKNYSLFQPTCKPGWNRKEKWSEEDTCCCYLDDMNKIQPPLPTITFDTPIFLLVIRIGPRSSPHHDSSQHDRLELQGLLLKPLGEPNETQAKTIEDSRSGSAFVRIGVGKMQLGKEDAEQALSHFGETVITIF